MSHHRQSRRARSGPSLPVLLAALVVCVVLLLLPALGRSTQQTAGVPSPAPSDAMPQVSPEMPDVSPVEPTETPAPTPVPTPTPAPTPSVSATASEANREVDMSYFSDALFIGDSRTEGLQLYSGIEGATFFCYKGITIFDVMAEDPKKVVTLDGNKYSVVGALEHTAGQFGKVYISLGVNELGYYDDQGYHDKFCALIDEVRRTQPDAVIYLQNVVPVNPELCAKNWPSYVNNEKVNTYNEILDQVAEEKEVVLLDLHSALGTSDGILAKENTSDGVHFNKAWYQEWLRYLMKHAV